MTAPDLQTLAAEIHANAYEKGWWPDTPGPEDYERAALMIGCEVAEMIEEYRRAECDEDLDIVRSIPIDGQYGRKPDGFPIELADIVIRTLDLCAAMGWPMPPRVDVIHPDDLERSPVSTFLCLQMWANRAHRAQGCACTCITWCLVLAQRYDIDLWAMVRLKHAYNQTRSHRHGGKRL